MSESEEITTYSKKEWEELEKQYQLWLKMSKKEKSECNKYHRMNMLLYPLTKEKLN